MADLSGRTLGQYEIHELIGEGGMASVYRATQRSIGREVAVKVLTREATHRQRLVERFYGEVELIARLQHPHILPVYDFGEQDEHLYVVMGYLSCGTLSDLIHRAPMALDQAARLVRQMADALEYAHGQGIIHRDVKPSNVLLDDESNAYVVDFGLAKVMEGGSSLTGTGVIGTPAYMAPEMATAEGLGPSVDVYALGATMYEMLAGRPPFEAPTPVGVMMAHVTQPIPDMTALRPDLPPEIQAVVERALAKQPADRYPTPRALAAALEKLTDTATPQVDSAVALTFTNVDGAIIFVDSFFLKMTHRTPSALRSLIGQPIHHVLGLEQSLISDLIHEVSRIGQVHQHVVDITDAYGEPLHVSVAATGTYDERGACIGVDFSFRYASTLGATAPHLSTPSSIFDSEEKSELEIYFSAQIDALRVLLVRLGGQRLGDHLQVMINETAERNEWPVRLEQSNVYVEMDEVRPDAYRALLTKGISYAVKVIGKPMVQKQIRAVNEQLGERALELAAQIELDKLMDEV